MHASLKAASKAVALTTGLALALPAAAISFECKLDNLGRSISVIYPEQTPVPCHVEYTKEGDTQILWQAENSEGYCEEKARAFATKHESWGWQCASQHITVNEQGPAEPAISAE